jgi:hypothetical protein
MMKTIARGLQSLLLLGSQPASSAMDTFIENMAMVSSQDPQGSVPCKLKSRTSFFLNSNEF